MEAWLATHAFEAFLGLVLVLSSGGVGLTQRLRRQLKECAQRCRKLTEENRRVRGDYVQCLEIQFVDRQTIRTLAKMVRDHRRELGRPEGDILLEVYDIADAELRARRLSAGVHATSSPQIEEYLSND